MRSGGSAVERKRLGEFGSRESWSWCHLEWERRREEKWGEEGSGEREYKKGKRGRRTRGKKAWEYPLLIDENEGRWGGGREATQLSTASLHLLALLCKVSLTFYFYLFLLFLFFWHLAFLPFAISCLCPLCLYFLPILFGGSLLSMPPLSISCL